MFLLRTVVKSNQVLTDAFKWNNRIELIETYVETFSKHVFFTSIYIYIIYQVID